MSNSPLNPWSPAPTAPPMGGAAGANYALQNGGMSQIFPQTQNADGTLPMVQPLSQGMSNPWDGMASQDGAAAVQGALQGQMNLTRMGSQMQDYAQMSAAYPSFPNPAGLGSQTPFGAAPTAPAPAPAPAPAAQSLGQSQGANPWMLQGEALAR